METDLNQLSDLKEGFCLVFNFKMLGSQNREKESKMVVAKRQGREKPLKIEQRKVKGRLEDRSEDFR